MGVVGAIIVIVVVVQNQDRAGGPFSRILISNSFCGQLTSIWVWLTLSQTQSNQMAAVHRERLATFAQKKFQKIYGVFLPAIVWFSTHL